MKHVLLFGLFISLAITSHIDDIDGELSKFSYDKVIFRTIKDCSLDKLPGVNYIL
jgi:hypothetical protein